jgi:8-oxo-dGTP pyrophosphatase MutT (NUDIX family)
MKLSTFDPRTVPIHQIDVHLPAVSLNCLQPQALRQRFASPPNWQVELLAEKRFVSGPSVPAAVLIPLVMRSQPSLLLTLRTQHLSTHSGQIAFPGGKVDASDANAIAAALRETHEEIGLAAASIEILGQLPVYSTGSAFAVTPVVALVRSDFTLQPNPNEVAEVFEVPLAFLMNPAHHQHHQMLWQNSHRHWLSMPYHDGTTERFIWGATAGMLRNLYRFLSA